MGFGYNEFGMGFDLFGTVFTIGFVLIIGFIIFAIFQGIKTWHSNNNSPRLDVEAKAVSKRTEISHSHHANAGDISGGHGFTHSSSTWYYVTFQVLSGDRLEFSVSGQEYGLIAEGDEGLLSFQGTRYLSFERYY